MGVRKNAKYLTAAEKEDFVRACVLMKAEIVNPGAPAAQRYSRWDEYVAVHRMIQNAFAPGSPGVNFGHGGSGAYSFFSWHRYFLFRFEKELQSHVPGIMLPYWDWADPAPLMTDTFLGPDGDPGTQIVTRGYFAEDAPGTGSNPTPAPPWWPAGLNGWQLHSAFPFSWEGPLTRNVGGALPTVTDLQEALGKSTYPSFQDAVESGGGLSGFHQMHNGLHGYIGGHMGNATASPFDPIFYLHHCNIDRLWAMWQMDGHATTYPLFGGNAEHHRNDIMYPWTGGAAGYGTNVNMAPIVMPDYSALGAQRNVDTLDHRALGYTYDTLPVVGVSLDRTGSMTQLTPDPMTTSAPDVTKWVAATRGVSAFFQDCEAAYASKEAYVFAGVETFRTAGGGHQFTPVFGGTPSGLVKSGGSHSRGAFDAAVAILSPGGGTPLADALTHADTALVKGPFADLPPGEQRYLAILTDGKRTTGSTVASIPAGSLGDTVVFAMGFGTGADVDYPTLDQLVTKGQVLPITQVFHGENAGTIDKFYTNSLAAAIGYTPIVDPVLELFAGEHAHVDFYATSAEDSFFISAQGMDFTDPHWSFHLVAPDGTVVYPEHAAHGGAGKHCCHAQPAVNVVRSNGRLSLFLRRDAAPHHLWVGMWRLMVAYKARDMGRMLMLPVGALLAPVSAGPVRGPRYRRPQSRSGKRAAQRLVARPNIHAFDLMPPFTSGDRRDACNVVVNIYARTRLRIGLTAVLGRELGFVLVPDLRAGKISQVRARGRLLSPKVDIQKLFAQGFDDRIARGARLRASRALKYDSGKILAKLEREDDDRFRLDDRVLAFKLKRDGAGEARAKRSGVPGVHHLGVLIRGAYHPEPGSVGVGHGGGHGGKAEMSAPEYFERILTYAVAAVDG